MMVEFIRELDSDIAEQCLVRKGDDYFVVSSITSAYDTGQPETLVFPADEDGNVTTYEDVAGGVGRTREQAIAELEGEPRSRDDRMFEAVEAAGGPLPFITKTLRKLGGDG